MTDKFLTKGRDCGVRIKEGQVWYQPRENIMILTTELSSWHPIIWGMYSMDETDIDLFTFEYLLEDCTYIGEL